MKLLFCIKCRAVFNLTYDLKYCDCKLTSGKYVNSLEAVYSGGYAVPIGFENHDFAKSVRYQPAEGTGERFDAFVIPKKCPTMKHYTDPL